MDVLVCYEPYREVITDKKLCIHVTIYIKKCIHFNCLIRDIINVSQDKGSSFQRNA